MPKTTTTTTTDAPVVVAMPAKLPPPPPLPKGIWNWIKTNLSSSKSASNSRALQTLIVFNIVAMLWVILIKANWYVHDNVRLVLITLITGGAGAYAAGKLGGKGD